MEIERSTHSLKATALQTIIFCQNSHQTSLTSTLWFLADDQTERSQYSCPAKLLNLCSDRTSQNRHFSNLPVFALEIAVSALKIDSKKSTGFDGDDISDRLLKAALPHIVGTLTTTQVRSEGGDFTSFAIIVCPISHARTEDRARSLIPQAFWRRVRRML